VYYRPKPTFVGLLLTYFLSHCFCADCGVTVVGFSAFVFMCFVRMK